MQGPTSADAAVLSLTNNCIKLFSKKQNSVPKKKKEIESIKQWKAELHIVQGNQILQPIP